MSEFIWLDSHFLCMSLLHHNLLISREDMVSLCGICNRLQNMKIEILKKYYDNVMRILWECYENIMSLLHYNLQISRQDWSYITSFCGICNRLQNWKLRPTSRNVEGKFYAESQKYWKIIAGRRTLKEYCQTPKKTCIHCFTQIILLYHFFWFAP